MCVLVCVCINKRKSSIKSIIQIQKPSSFPKGNSHETVKWSIYGKKYPEHNPFDSLEHHGGTH